MMSTDAKGQSARPETVGHSKSVAEDGKGAHDRAEEKIKYSRGSVAVARIVEHNLDTGRSPGRSPSGLEAALLAFLQSNTSNSPVPVERRIFLTMAESADFSGLPVVFLR